jgi:hypothetical protein
VRPAHARGGHGLGHERTLTAWIQTDPTDDSIDLTRDDTTGPHQSDGSGPTLKVAARVRIPLGVLVEEGHDQGRTRVVALSALGRTHTAADRPGPSGATPDEVIVRDADHHQCRRVPSGRMAPENSPSAEGTTWGD